MLRVGLTGGLGSGKSAIALLWAAEGVPVFNADELGRALMQPGQPVYHHIVEAFGPGVVLPDGRLDRAALAREAFAERRLPELNRIVHPAVIDAQDRELTALAAAGAQPLAVVESALIFEASGTDVPGWRERFDKLVLVAAPEALRVERFVARSHPQTAAQENALREDARRRMAAQLPESYKRPHCDYILENHQTLLLLRRASLRVLSSLRRDAVALASLPPPG